MSPEQRYKIIDDLRLTQKIINLLDNTQISHLTLEQETGLE